MDASDEFKFVVVSNHHPHSRKGQEGEASSTSGSLRSVPVCIYNSNKNLQLQFLWSKAFSLFQSKRPVYKAVSGINYQACGSSGIALRAKSSSHSHLSRLSPSRMETGTGGKCKEVEEANEVVPVAAPRRRTVKNSKAGGGRPVSLCISGGEKPQGDDNCGNQAFHLRLRRSQSLRSSGSCCIDSALQSNVGSGVRLSSPTFSAGERGDSPTSACDNLDSGLDTWNGRTLTEGMKPKSKPKNPSQIVCTISQKIPTNDYEVDSLEKAGNRTVVLINGSYCNEKCQPYPESDEYECMSEIDLNSEGSDKEKFQNQPAHNELDSLDLTLFETIGNKGADISLMEEHLYDTVCSEDGNNSSLSCSGNFDTSHNGTSCVYINGNARSWSDAGSEFEFKAISAENETSNTTTSTIIIIIAIIHCFLDFVFVVKGPVVAFRKCYRCFSFSS